MDALAPGSLPLLRLPSALAAALSVLLAGLTHASSAAGAAPS